MRFILASLHKCTMIHDVCTWNIMLHDIYMYYMYYLKSRSRDKQLLYILYYLNCEKKIFQKFSDNLPL